MDIQKQIREVFGLRASARAGAWDQHAEILDWRAVGFPGVYSTSLFLSVAGQRRFVEQTILPFPNDCCRCGRPACTHVEFRPFLPIPLVRLRSTRVHLRGIPHCADHGGELPQAFAGVHVEPERYAYALLVGMHRPFLEESLALNRRDGEPPPPWVAFPRSRPFGGFNEGTNETWMHRCWVPFWSGLSLDERNAFLARHGAPSSWREWSDAFTNARDQH